MGDGEHRRARGERQRNQQLIGEMRLDRGARDVMLAKRGDRLVGDDL